MVIIGEVGYAHVTKDVVGCVITPLIGYYGWLIRHYTIYHRWRHGLVTTDGRGHCCSSSAAVDCHATWIRHHRHTRIRPATTNSITILLAIIELRDLGLTRHIPYVIGRHYECLATASINMKRLPGRIRHYLVNDRHYTSAITLEERYHNIIQHTIQVALSNSTALLLRENGRIHDITTLVTAYCEDRNGNNVIIVSRRRSLRTTSLTKSR